MVVRFPALLLTFLAVPCNGARAFDPPDARTRQQAVGDLSGLPPALQRALDPGADFAPLEAPADGDWLAEHPEPGQGFEAYAHSGFNRPDGVRRNLYLLPIGEFPRGSSPDLDLLGRAGAAMFGLPVKTLPPMALEANRITSRTNPHTRKLQLLSTDLLDLLETRLPPDAYCLLGVTMQDLYPDPSWNFVFGQASLVDRVGVFSFARYDPAFYGEPRGKDAPSLILRRSLKVLLHETAHMFGLQHCIHYQCLVNGSNHLKESDDRPMHLCPVCLRKLQHAVGFDVAEHYRGLLEAFTTAGLLEEAAFALKRLRHILEDQ